VNPSWLLRLSKQHTPDIFTKGFKPIPVAKKAKEEVRDIKAIAGGSQKPPASPKSSANKAIPLKRKSLDTSGPTGREAVTVAKIERLESSSGVPSAPAMPVVPPPARKIAGPAPARPKSATDGLFMPKKVSSVAISRCTNPLLTCRKSRNCSLAFGSIGPLPCPTIVSRAQKTSSIGFGEDRLTRSISRQ
jgi:hypothetical protein